MSPHIAIAVQDQIHCDLASFVQHHFAAGVLHNMLGNREHGMLSPGDMPAATSLYCCRSSPAPVVGSASTVDRTSTDLEPNAISLDDEVVMRSADDRHQGLYDKLSRHRTPAANFSFVLLVHVG